MKDAIRMYHLFFPRKCLIPLVYILYPLAAIAISGVWYAVPEFFGVYVLSVVCGVSAIVVVEYLLDTFMLFGIAAKDNKALEYMKTSARGVHLIQTGVWVDGFRRVVTTLVSLGVVYRMAGCYFANLDANVEDMGMTAPDMVTFLQCVIMVLLFTEVGLVFTRRTRNVLINMLIVYLASAIACALVIGVLQYATVVTVLISGIVLVAVMVIGRKLLVKRVRESYYDEGYKGMSQTA